MDVHSGSSVSAAVVEAGAALRGVAAALEHARQLGVRVNVAVVDASGLPAAFVRMPGAPLHSIDIAWDKAYTAASFGLATSAWAGELEKHSPAVREGLPLRPRFVAFGGGVPIRDGHALIGAIGVSGASEEQDDAVARAGARAIDVTA